MVSFSYFFMSLVFFFYFKHSHYIKKIWLKQEQTDASVFYVDLRVVTPSLKHCGSFFGARAVHCGFDAVGEGNARWLISICAP